MMPATGMGATMGLKDALVISELVRSLPWQEWGDIPRLYQKQRKHVVDRVQQEAFIIGRMMLLDSPLKELRNWTVKLIPQFVISHSLKHM
jgi:hypothetical protein